MLWMHPPADGSFLVLFSQKRTACFSLFPFERERRHQMRISQTEMDRA
jgi:hypothetical protein